MDKNTLREFAIEAWNGDHDSFVVLQDTAEELGNMKLVSSLRSQNPHEVLKSVAELIGWPVNTNVSRSGRLGGIEVDQGGGSSVWFGSGNVGKMQYGDDEISFEYDGGVDSVSNSDFDVVKYDNSPTLYVTLHDDGAELQVNRLGTGGLDVVLLDPGNGDPSNVDATPFTEQAETAVDDFDTAAAHVDIMLSNLKQGLGLSKFDTI